MSKLGSRNDTISLDGVRGLTEALAGAFAEGVDLGPRQAQIRLLGQSLRADIEALRVVLADLDVQDAKGAPLDFDGLARLARAAQLYGLGDPK